MRLRTLTDAGFTLIEVMISLALVAGLLVTLLYTLAHHLGVAEKHSGVTIATCLAKAKLAELERNQVEEKGRFPAPYALFSYQTSLHDSPYPGLIEIAVVVQYDTESVRLSELVRQPRR